MLSHFNLLLDKLVQSITLSPESPCSRRSHGGLSLPGPIGTGGLPIIDVGSPPWHLKVHPAAYHRLAQIIKNRQLILARMP